MKLIVRAPAKVNLGLDVASFRKDRLIEWDMVMTSVSLNDYVQIETQDSSNNIEVHSNNGFLPEDSRNLAYKAARLFLQEASLNQSVRIEIDKHIPIAAGLGGGSADAAAVLRGLNEIFKTNYSLKKLAKIGIKIDSDVPFCVYSRTSRVSGKGEVVVPLNRLPKMWLILAKPGISVSTPRILHQISGKALEHPKIDNIVNGIQNSDYNQIAKNLGNSLESITTQNYPQIFTLEQRMRKYGADGSLMSGSGPTVFGMAKTHSRAQRVYNSLSGFCSEVYLTQPLNIENP